MESEIDTNEKTKFITDEESEKQPVDFTDLIGSNGWWQKRIIILIVIISIFNSWNVLGMTFLAFPVDHWCARPQSSNISLEKWKTDFLPATISKGKLQPSQCEMFVTNYSSDGLIIRKTEPCESWEYSSDYNSLVNKWDMVCDKEWMISTCQSIYMLGFMLSVSTCGQLADLYGRHKIVIMNIFIFLTAGVTAVFSNCFVMFLICRFFIGFGFSGLELVIHVLLIETLGPKYRAKYAFMSGYGWQIGCILLPLLAWSISDWFYLHLAMILPCFLSLSFYWLLPESPRWLLSNGEYEKAFPILQKAAKMNGKKEISIHEIKNMYNEGEKSRSQATFLDLFRTANLRKRTLCMFFIWITIAFTFYGLALNTNQLYGNKYVNFFMFGVADIPAPLFSIVTNKYFGRKRPLIFALFTAGALCLSCIFVPERWSVIRTAFALCGKFLITSSFGMIYVFSSEIFPTVARTVGTGSCSTVARIGTTIAPFMKDLGEVTHPSVPLALFGILCIFSSLIATMLPETSQRPIPESIEDAEHFEKKTLLNEMY